MPRPWRLLVDGPAPGPWNMGVDEALMASAAANEPALRLYTWDGPWLSLGYAQRLDSTRRRACEGAGVGVVRRVTGGRAVLHGGDLTYAVAAPEAALPAGLRATYGALAAGLLAGLELLGIEVSRTTSQAPAPGCDVFDCFAEPAGDELCAGGRKLVGSAQRRADGAVLQHGSVRLAPDPAEALAAASLLPGGATSLSELGVAVPLRKLQEALLEGLSAALGAVFEPSQLRPDELRQASNRAERPTAPTGPFTRGGSQGSRQPADT